MTRRESIHRLECRVSVVTRFARHLICFAIVICLFTSVAAQRRQAGSKAATSRGDGGVALNATTRAALDSAIAALEANDLESAERAARQAVKSAPRSPIPRNVLGVILDKKGRSDEALVEINAAIQLDPKFVSARNNLGRILAQSGKTQAAIAEFERVLALDPTHIQAHYNLGALYGDAGDFIKAAEHLARARASNPDDPQLGLAFLNVAYRRKPNYRGKSSCGPDRKTVCLPAERSLHSGNSISAKPTIRTRSAGF